MSGDIELMGGPPVPPLGKTLVLGIYFEILMLKTFRAYGAHRAHEAHGHRAHGGSPSAPHWRKPWCLAFTLKY